jgi:uncharacterized membrane protein YsdA (DUF1294 family)
MIYFIIIYLIINIISGIIMYSDKQKSIKGKERIPEVYLFLYAVLFGALGVLLSMYIIRHKVKKWYFNIGIPLILIQNISFLYLCNKVTFEKYLK